MPSSRRTFIGWLAPAAALFSLSRAVGAQGTPPPQVKATQPPSKPPFSSKQIGEQEPPSPDPDPHKVLKSYDKDIKKDIQKLLELAQELKKEVDKTDSAEVLNLSMMKKAEEIEKLAKKIQSMARG
jgi:hypothetical protein